MRLFIPGDLTTFNNYVRAERGHYRNGARIKKVETNRVAGECAAADIPPVRSYPVGVIFRWYRSDTRTDPDNIDQAKKYIFDGLVKAGVLRDDGWAEIAITAAEYYLDRHNPGVEIEIIENITRGAMRVVLLEHQP